MNRFETHPRKTIAIVLVVLIIAMLAGIEVLLATFHDELELPEVHEKVSLRYLRLREWPPGSTRVFRTPDARRNDAIGPVDEIYELKIDDSGYIWPSRVHETPDIEIVFLGGSTTECLYVRPETRFPYLAGRLIEEATKRKMNALNGGKSGNNTMHSVLAYLGKIAPQKPDYVVLMHATNDVAVLNNTRTYWNDDKGLALVLDDRMIARRGPVREFLRSVRDQTIPYTYRVVRNGLDAAGDRIAEYMKTFNAGGDDETEVKPAAGKPDQAATDNRDSKQEDREEILRKSFEAALRTFVRSAKAWGSEPVLMTQVLVQRTASNGPAREGDLLSPEALKRGDFDVASFASTHAFANAIVRHVALSEGALLIDLAAARDWSGEDVYDGLHFTETGSRRVAEIISGALTEHISRASGSLRASQVR